MTEVSYRVSLALGDGPSGDRLCALLQAVGQTGSLHRAAGELHLSYRYAWGLVKKAESQLGRPLLASRVGGEGGGGAELTEAARELLAGYRRAQAMVVGVTPAPPDAAAVARPLLLASTIGPIEAGIVPALEEAFYRHAGTMLRHIAAGSGQALDIARDGRVDLVLSHAPALEAEFVDHGFATGRYPLMYNDFLLAGPAADPAGVRTAASAAAAFARIAAAGAAFVSRGDRSGTHLKELSLWDAAGVSPVAPWYRISERGVMGSAATLAHAAAASAYTLVDRATWIAAAGAGLEPLLAGDPALRNEFALLPVSPDRFPQVAGGAARAFVAWATGPEAQALIGRFGVDRYGAPLFFPASA